MDGLYRLRSQAVDTIRRVGGGALSESAVDLLTYPPHEEPVVMHDGSQQGLRVDRFIKVIYSLKKLDYECFNNGFGNFTSGEYFGLSRLNEVSEHLRPRTKDYVHYLINDVPTRVRSDQKFTIDELTRASANIHRIIREVSKLLSKALDDYDPLYCASLEVTSITPGSRGLKIVFEGDTPNNMVDDTDEDTDGSDSSYETNNELRCTGPHRVCLVAQRLSYLIWRFSPSPNSLVRFRIEQYTSDITSK
jgi:hypothetical protein